MMSESKSDITISENLYEAKAQTVLHFLKSHIRYSEEFLPRPFFVEFTGSPSSGKTTTINELYKFLRRQGFRVLRPQEGAEVVQHIERTTPLYNIRTGLYALQMLIDFSSGHPYDIVIFDRGIFDAFSWMMYWEEKEQLAPAERELIQKFFLSRFWREKIDVAYFMVCDPDEALRREQKNAVSHKLGKTTNPESLRKLKRSFENAYELLLPENSQLVLLNTAKLSELQVFEQVALHVLEVFEAKSKDKAAAI